MPSPILKWTETFSMNQSSKSHTYHLPTTAQKRYFWNHYLKRGGIPLAISFMSLPLLNSEFSTSTLMFLINIFYKQKVSLKLYHKNCLQNTYNTKVVPRLEPETPESLGLKNTKMKWLIREKISGSPIILSTLLKNEALSKCGKQLWEITFQK